MATAVRLALVLVSLAALILTPAIEDTAGLVRYIPAGVFVDGVAVLVLIAVSLSFWGRQPGNA